MRERNKFRASRGGGKAANLAAATKPHRIAARVEDARQLTKPIAEGGQGLSNRKIAKLTGVDHKTVAADLRGENSPKCGEIPHPSQPIVPPGSFETLAAASATDISAAVLTQTFTSDTNQAAAPAAPGSWSSLADATAVTVDQAAIG